MDRITKKCSMDRISQLPEPIQHRILAFLERDEVARASVLSKAWRSIVQSRAVLEFYEHKSRPRLTTSVFINLIQESIHKVIAQARIIQRFSLHVRSYDRSSWENNIDQWMQQLVEAKVKDLSLVLHDSDHYRLPPFVLLSETFTRLRLCRCDLLWPKSVRLPNLRHLYLQNMHLSNETIHEFISGCPNLKTLKLCSCDGITRICVLNHAKLNAVELNSSTNLTEVKIGAPNLRVFKISNNDMPTSDTKIDLLGCESTLRVLRLSYVQVTEEDLTSLVSKFPGLEEICLEYLHVESIKIPNQKLLKLNVSRCRRLERIEIGSPNLRVLTYCHNKYPFYHVNGSTSLTNTFVFYATFTRELLKKSLLVSVKELVPKIKEFRNIKLIVKSSYRMDPIVCDEVDPNFLEFLSHANYKKPRVEVMHIPTYEYMVDHLLNPHYHWKSGHWEIRRWVIISVVSRDKQSATKLLEVLSKKSLKENAEPNCCRYKSRKCWKNHLYHAEMISEEAADTLDLYHPKMPGEKTETSGLFKSFDAMKYEITRIKLHWI